MADARGERHFDARVAELVMGWRWARFDYEPFCWPTPHGKMLSPWRWLVPPTSTGTLSAPQGDESWYIDNVPKFSTEIAQAMAVVDRMYELGFHFTLVRENMPAPWMADFAGVAVEDQTAELAICRAALKKLGFESVVSPLPASTPAGGE